jgi:hypothetical protein
VAWNEYPHAIYPDPLDASTSVWECPTHGTFEIKDGQQVFDVPDTWVRGPNGERLFAL